MKPYYQDEYVTLYCGDCRELLPTIPANSIDIMFTDPPYGHNNNNGDLIHNWEKALGKAKPGIVEEAQKLIDADDCDADFGIHQIERAEK